MAQIELLWAETESGRGRANERGGRSENPGSAPEELRKERGGKQAARGGRLWVSDIAPHCHALEDGAMGAAAALPAASTAPL
jgi:hypothetical protein